MPYAPVDLVEVVAWGRTVGAAIVDPRSGYVAFEYDPTWIRLGTELAPLTMPAEPGVRVFPNLPELTFHRLPAMLADSLPDRFGHALIDAHLARSGASHGDVTALDRLAFLGPRAMGALEFRPPTGPTEPTGSAFEIAELVAEARRAVEGSFGTESDATAGVRHLLEVGTSAGGARAKAVIAWNPLTGEIRSGQLPAESGFEHWLLKFDGVGADFELGLPGHYGRIEYAYSLMASAAGVVMCECRLLEEGGRAHFMTRRFDRTSAGDKVHVQTLCAMAELDFNLIGVHDYAQLFDVIDQLELGAAAREQAFRRMVLNVAAANCDDHTKNHAFARDESTGWTLAPAYDVTHAYNPNGHWTSQHLMAVGGRFKEIGRRDLLVFADRHLVPAAGEVIADVNAAVASWTEFVARAAIPTDIAATVASDFNAV